MRLLLVSLIASCCATWGYTPAQAAPPPNNTVYHVFVRSFADGDGNGVGDLAGLRAKLDYLNDGKPETDDDLEVGILWLMPIFPCHSHHGYDVTDFRAVNPEYGNLGDLDNLIKAAHDRGMRVILDLPLNHTSHDHPWFKAAMSGPADAKRGWYHIYANTPGNDKEDGWHRRTDGTGAEVKYFAPFGYDMPDLKPENSEVTKELLDIASFWLGKGVDGFRLDAAKHLFAWTSNPTRGEIEQNNAWWRAFSTHVEHEKPGAILVGEVLGDRELLREHAWGLDGLIDEPFMKEARWFIGHPFDGFVGQYKAFIDDAEAENTNAPPFHSFPYLASHDKNPRLASELKNGFPGTAAARYRLGLCMLMSLGSHPMLYYGDELMQEGWKWNGKGATDGGDGSEVYDETLREPFPWYRNNQGDKQTHWSAGKFHIALPIFDHANDGVSVEEEAAQPTSVLQLTRALTNLRTAVPQLGQGTIGRRPTDSADWLVFERVRDGSGEQPVLVLINPTANGKNYQFKPDWYPEYQNAEMLFWCDGQSGNWKQTVTAPPKIQNEAFVAPFGMVVLRKS